MYGKLLLTFLLLLSGCCEQDRLTGPTVRQQDADISLVTDFYVSKIDCPLCRCNSKMYHMKVNPEGTHLIRGYKCDEGHITVTTQLRSQHTQHIYYSGKP